MKPYELDIIHNQMNTIADIDNGSIAEEIGLEAGDQVLAINGKQILDVIDYRYSISNEEILLSIQKKDGELWDIEIEKDVEEDLGINFLSPLLDNQKQCTNNCIFCFIDQMPPGMRDSLYIKDDDSRLSFLQGNYITLTNVKEEDLKRIVEYKLSPINVSVHTTNPELRVKLLKNRFAGEILERISYLTKNGITVNAQIVAIPGINDGAELERTLEDLSNLYPNLSSVAVVPVGITKYRENLPTLNIFTKEEAKNVIDVVCQFSQKMKKMHGFGWVYPSDEFFLIAEEEIPESEFYEGYPQYENGVGLLRSFYDEAIEELENVPGGEEKGSVTLITSEYPSSCLKNLLNLLQKKYPNLNYDLKVITNSFFGNTVKVAGLLTAKDVLEQLKGGTYDGIIVPRVMFRQDKFITLDDMTLKDLEEKLSCPIYTVENNGASFIRKILEVGLNG